MEIAIPCLYHDPGGRPQAGSVHLVDPTVVGADVRDRHPPVLLGVPPDARVGCEAVPPPADVVAEDDCDPAPIVTFSEASEPGPCPATHVLRRTWTATDSAGRVAVAEQRLEVVDDQPPVIEPSGTLVACLWPPNHSMHCFSRAELAPRITDACSEFSWRIVGCESDQPDDGLGDGSTDDDCVVSADGESFCVRAERSGLHREGRTYSVSIVATDACGNASSPVTVASVHVPHDRPGSSCAR